MEGAKSRNGARSWLARFVAVLLANSSPRITVYGVANWCSGTKPGPVTTFRGQFEPSAAVLPNLVAKSFRSYGGLADDLANHPAV